MDTEIKKEFFGAMMRDPMVFSIYSMYRQGTITTWEEMLMKIAVELWRSKNEATNEIIRMYSEKTTNFVFRPTPEQLEEVKKHVEGIKNRGESQWLKNT